MVVSLVVSADTCRLWLFVGGACGPAGCQLTVYLTPNKESFSEAQPTSRSLLFP